MAEQLLLRTPRTDAYVEFWLKDRIALWTDFARSLERELNEAIAATAPAGHMCLLTFIRWRLKASKVLLTN